MEYTAKRNFTHQGVKYEKNQLVPVNKDEIDALKKYNFIKDKKASKAKK